MTGSEDWEVQAWVQDVHENGFGMIKDSKEATLGLPSKLDNKEKLVMYLSKLIYMATQHTSLN